MHRWTKLRIALFTGLLITQRTAFAALYRIQQLQPTIECPARRRRPNVLAQLQPAQACASTPLDQQRRPHPSTACTSSCLPLRIGDVAGHVEQGVLRCSRRAVSSVTSKLSPPYHVVVLFQRVMGIMQQLRAPTLDVQSDSYVH